MSCHPKPCKHQHHQRLPLRDNERQQGISREHAPDELSKGGVWYQGCCHQPQNLQAVGSGASILSHGLRTHHNASIIYIHIHTHIMNIATLHIHAYT